MTDTEHLLHTLRSQGRFCGGSGSLMYEELFELVAKDVEAKGVFATILSGHEDDPSRDAIPLRLLAGLHRLVLDSQAPALRRWYPSTGGTWDAGAAWPEIVLAATRHTDSLRAALGQPPQTNEVGRSAALIGGLLRINRRFGLPVRLFEIGPSGGLNLRADHYHYRYAGGQWGNEDSPVRIDDAWQGALPPPGTLQIVERHGYDIAPIDVTSTGGEMTALSYLRPDQSARLDRLRGAIAVARKVPAQLHRQRAGDAVGRLTLADGTLTVLWHSIMWQYLPDGEQAVIRDGIDALGAQASVGSPFAHLTLEPAREEPGTALKFLVQARVWPGGSPEVLAECHAHGAPVRWN